jgi:hypothetical protein
MGRPQDRRRGQEAWALGTKKDTGDKTVAGLTAAIGSDPASPAALRWLNDLSGVVASVLGVEQAFSDLRPAFAALSTTFEPLEVLRRHVLEANRHHYKNRRSMNTAGSASSAISINLPHSGSLSGRDPS